MSLRLYASFNTSTILTKNFFFYFFKNATVGTAVIQVKAIDNDVGPNAAVLYRLKQDTVGNYRSFAIDQVSGLITVKSPLDRERQKIYDVSARRCTCTIGCAQKTFEFN